MGYGLIAAVMWGLSAVAAAKAARRTGTYLAVLCGQGLGVLSLLALAAVVRPSFAAVDGAVALHLAGAGLVGLVGYLCYYRAIEDGPVGLGSAISSTYGGIAALLAVIVLGERLGVIGIAGVVLAVAGVAMAIARATGATPPEATPPEARRPITLPPPGSATPSRPPRHATPGPPAGSAPPGSATPGRALPGSATPGRAHPGGATPGRAPPGGATPHSAANGRAPASRVSGLASPSSVSRPSRGARAGSPGWPSRSPSRRRSPTGPAASCSATTQAGRAGSARP